MCFAGRSNPRGIIFWSACLLLSAIGPAMAAEDCPVPGAPEMTCIASGSIPVGRPPYAHDDSRAGYAVGDLWQAGGQVWHAVSVQPDAARWDPVPVVRPGDPFGIHTVFAGGTMRMIANYTGPALDIAMTVSGRVLQRTIAIRPDGHFDAPALEVALATRDNGTAVLVTRIYDQSGHHHDLTAIPGHAAAHIGAVRIAGHDVISWGERNGPGGFSIPADMALPRDGFFFGTTGMVASSNSASGAYPVLATFGQGGQAVRIFTGSYTLDGFVHLGDANNPDQRSGFVLPSSPVAFGIGSGPNGYRLVSSRAIVAHPSVIRSGTLSGGFIGYGGEADAWVAQGRGTALYTGIVIADAAPSDDMLLAFQASAAADNHDLPQQRTVFVAIGDSRTEGYQLADGGNWPVLMQRMARYHSYNFAVSGATTRQMLAALPAAGAAASGAARRVAVVFGGFNDHLEQSNIPADETVAKLATIVKTLKGFGFTVALMAEANTSGPRRVAIADALRRGRIAADLVIDPFAAGQKLFNVEDRRYWQADDTHPTDAGAAMLADVVWAHVRPLLSPVEHH
ncbi:SGNH/GDSL hydrolase family protein [Gluconacetobacter asukensis]|uniref:SGNH/GDSL hydrolase family protein n=1 Tax=Gluconacetobacter asukensis TaxID=1017181 RepID=A0A7W4IYY2_9PROT|nr:SGNH/GDSL hydrolase family protein [Gluconacetobacter asukensis]MBB2171362.1 SGNH/GDSL hydrolase family protein [Gluconacetobacter asukensis]